MHQLLQSGALARADIEYYLAYSNKIFEFADRYDWESILDYDYTYRELQAENQFPWGTISPHMELQLLYPKQRGPPSGARFRAQGSRDGSGSSQQQECKLFKARGTCSFGADCKYRHVRADKPPAKNGPTTPTAYM